MFKNYVRKDLFLFLDIGKTEKTETQAIMVWTFNVLPVNHSLNRSVLGQDQRDGSASYGPLCHLTTKANAFGFYFPKTTSNGIYLNARKSDGTIVESGDYGYTTNFIDWVESSNGQILVSSNGSHIVRGLQAYWSHISSEFIDTYGYDSVDYSAIYNTRKGLFLSDLEIFLTFFCKKTLYGTKYLERSTSTGRTNRDLQTTLAFLLSRLWINFLEFSLQFSHRLLWYFVF